MEASREATCDAATPDFSGTIAQLRTQASHLFHNEEQCLEVLESTLALQEEHLARERTQSQQELAAGREELTASREVLAAHREELAAARHELADARQELAAGREEIAAGREELARQSQQLADEAEALRQSKGDFAAQQARWQGEVQETRAASQDRHEQLHQWQDQLSARELEIEKATRQAQRTAAVAHDELVAEREQWARQKDRLDTQQAELERERERLADLEGETKAQRRRIAREFQSQRTEQLAELQRQRAELAALAAGSDADLRKQLAAATEESARLHVELNEQRSLATQRGGEIGELEKRLADHTSEFALLREAHDKLSQEFALLPVAVAHDPAELDELRAERDRLAADLAETRRQLAQSQLVPDEDPKMEEMRRRFEMAVEDVRDLKHRNAELEEKLANVRQASPIAAPPGGGMDWESQKRRMLAALEADGDDSADPRRVQERLTIEGTVRITDEVVGRKDQEIQELRQLLAEQSSNIGNVAVGASALAELLDKDEIVVAERQKLVALQAEWREKLRQAEVDLSVDRAKVTRERAELEDKLREIKSAQIQAGDANRPVQPGAKPPRGRWLTRLGLKDNPE